MRFKYLFVVFVRSLYVAFLSAENEKPPVVVDDDGTIHVSAFKLPESSFLQEETRSVLKHERDVLIPEREKIAESCPKFEGVDIENIPAIRECLADIFYVTSSPYKKMRKQYDVKISSEVIGGVYVEIFTPVQPVQKDKRDRVLINVHGGDFQYGSRTTSRLESIPIAVVGGTKVISIDYRMAPEYQFPAGSEDVEAVYREVLKQNKPENIGIFGCSAGGILAAQSIAWFVDRNLPLPAAIGMFCAAAADPWKGDSQILGRATTGYASSFDENPYFQGADPSSPLVFPIASDDILQQFPPSLLISGTRDFTLSSIVKTHTALRRLDVDADLLVWEGLPHGFHFNPDLPESREAYKIIAEFFDKHLGEK